MTRATSGRFHNSYFWMAPETPMKKHFHTALKCACHSYKSSTAFPSKKGYLKLIHTCIKQLYQFRYIPECTGGSVYTLWLTEWFLQGSCPIKCHWEGFIRSHLSLTCLLDVSCHLGLLWAFAWPGRCVALCKNEWHQLTAFKGAALF